MSNKKASETETGNRDWDKAKAADKAEKTDKQNKAETRHNNGEKRGKSTGERRGGGPTNR